MDKLLIRGGRRLHGEVAISGAKNAALPELCAALLTSEPVTLPTCRACRTSAPCSSCMRNMGVQAERSARPGGDAGRRRGELARGALRLVKTMRLHPGAGAAAGALLGEATVSLPGGCAIGSRPVDQHIKGLQAMGARSASSTATSSPARAAASRARITTDMVTVTGTENLLMAATLAEGETVLENAAQEPEIPDLAELLIAMGAKIEGHGTSRIRIQGVERLHGARTASCRTASRPAPSCAPWPPPAARCAARCTRRRPSGPVIDKLREAGAGIEAGSDWIRVRSPGGRPRR